jgi:arabinogalactan endo-1,4-beta-galactosidase
MESSGKVFHDSTGKTADLLDILKQYGVNSIRLRTWVNPSDGWCGKADLLKMAKRARGKGFRLMVDFHYSDTWADPGKQTKPAAWASYSQDQLVQAVKTYTTDILSSLKDSGVVPEWVQVGNETNDGMLWPANTGEPGGRITVNGAAQFAAIVQSGSQAVKLVDPSALVVVHIANGWDNGLFRWVFDSLKAKGTSWDVVGMSLYPDSSNWRTQAAQALANMQDMVSRYGKKVVVSEVGFAMSQSDTSYHLLKLLLANTKSVQIDAGLGVFYWEPEAYYGWQGYQLSAFDDSGKPTKALDAFQEAARTTSITARDHANAIWERRMSEIVWLGDHPAPYRILDLSGAVVEQGIAMPGKPVGTTLNRGFHVVWTSAGSSLWGRF